MAKPNNKLTKFPLGFRVYTDKSGNRHRFRLLDAFNTLVANSPFVYKTQRDARAAGYEARDVAKAHNR